MNYFIKTYQFFITNLSNIFILIHFISFIANETFRIWNYFLNLVGMLPRGGNVSKLKKIKQRWRFHWLLIGMHDPYLYFNSWYRTIWIDLVISDAKFVLGLFKLLLNIFIKLSQNSLYLKTSWKVALLLECLRSYFTGSFL